MKRRRCNLEKKNVEEFSNDDLSILSFGDYARRKKILKNGMKTILVKNTSNSKTYCR